MITKTKSPLIDKVTEVYEELKKMSLWKNDTPDWVHSYNKCPNKEIEFIEWLQFVFLPNKLQGKNNIHFDSIAPQAVRFCEKDINSGRLLQLLVELDSITD
jgi:uncharacterized protein YqcC (DUF446 family)